MPNLGWPFLHLAMVSSPLGRILVGLGLATAGLTMLARDRRREAAIS